MVDQADYFPMLGIHEFGEKQSKACQLLFHELRGKRIIDKPHKHDFFIVILFEKGEGIHSIDFVEYPIGNHQLHLIFPNQVHEWVIGKKAVAYQLMISREWYEIFLPTLRFSSSYYQQHPVFDVPKEIYDLLLHEFQAIKKELQEDPIFWELIQKRSEIMGLLISKSAERAFQASEDFHENPIVAKFLNLIDEYYKTERSITFYASKLHISANYLNIVCKKNTHISASALIQNRILLEAKRLLKVSEMSVKDIVYELGFYDHASFSKFFKTQTGMTPSQFKE